MQSSENKMENPQTPEITEENLQEAINEAKEIILEETPEAKIIVLEDRIKELEDKNLRLLAEMQNMRNRHAKEIKDAHEYSITKFANDMIEVMENLNRAFDAIPNMEDEIYKKIVEGLNLTYEEVKRIFGKYGIERIAPVAGEKFDVKFHQAVVHIPTPDEEEGAVVQLIQAGYTLKDRLLRPAMVGVAKKVEAAN